MKKYMVYIDDGERVYKSPVPAENEDEARAYVKGCGEVIAVKDVTNDYPISAVSVSDALERAGFDTAEVAYMLHCLSLNSIID